MAMLLRDLPGFACDFSGVASYVSRMSGMGIIHAPNGCIGNYVGFDEPSWFTNPGMIFSSSMREDEAIFGLDDIVIEKMINAVSRLQPDFHVLIGCPPAALIGTDYKAISDEVEEQTGVPGISVDTNGFDTYCGGAEKYFRAMAERFLQPMKTKKRTINVLGYNHLDYCNDDDLVDLCHLLDDKWDNVNCCDSLDDFCKLPEAEENIVVSSSALNLARYMESEFGIPYSYELPISGTYDVDNVSKCDDRVLIIGDQVISESIRNLVEGRYGYECDVATFFGLDKKISRIGDANLVTEDNLKSLLSRGYDVIIGDPLFEKFTESKFIGIPHVAVSSKLFWNKHIHTFRKELLNTIDGILV